MNTEFKHDHIVVSQNYPNRRYRLKINVKFSSKPWKDTRLAFLLTFKHPRHHAIFILVLLFIEEKNPNEIIKSNQIKKTLLPKHDYCTHSVTDIYGIL